MCRLAPSCVTASVSLLRRLSPLSVLLPAGLMCEEKRLGNNAERGVGLSPSGAELRVSLCTQRAAVNLADPRAAGVLSVQLNACVGVCVP